MDKKLAPCPFCKKRVSRYYVTREKAAYPYLGIFIGNLVMGEKNDLRLDNLNYLKFCSGR